MVVCSSGRNPDFESGSPGSIPGMTFMIYISILAHIPERSKGRVSRSRASASWVRIPLCAVFLISGLVSKGDPFKIIQITCFIRRFLTKLNSDFYEKLS